MIIFRRLFWLDVLTLIPVLIFGSFGEMLAWMGGTFLVGFVIGIFALGQVRSFFQSVRTNEPVNPAVLSGLFAPGIAGALLMLPGLLTDLLALVVLVGFCIAKIRMLFSPRREQTTTQRQGQRDRKGSATRKDRAVIEPQYETIDESKHE